MKPLSRSFYHRATVETEACIGGYDLASHSAAGITSRTRVVFGAIDEHWTGIVFARRKS